MQNHCHISHVDDEIDEEKDQFERNVYISIYLLTIICKLFHRAQNIEKIKASLRRRSSEEPCRFRIKQSV